jgi:hypothetical protein
MNVGALRARWAEARLKERSAAQEHFIDLCRLFGVATPAEDDPTGERDAFETGATKATGGTGFADVWKRGPSPGGTPRRDSGCSPTGWGGSLGWTGG